MQLIPIDEAVREIQIRDAKEGGKEEKAFEVARSMLFEGLSVEIIRRPGGALPGMIPSCPGKAKHGDYGSRSGMLGQEASRY